MDLIEALIVHARLFVGATLQWCMWLLSNVGKSDEHAVNCEARAKLGRTDTCILGHLTRFVVVPFSIGPIRRKEWLHLFS